MHPHLKKILWGMIPCVQAMLLSRYLREDFDAYSPLLCGNKVMNLLVLITYDINITEAVDVRCIRSVAKQCVN